ncbi:MAG: type sorting protein [Bacteroidota bacterium]|nr:type sorting protein [Bacteroidota bacterium]
MKYILIIALLAVFVLVSCGNNSVNNPPAKSKSIIEVVDIPDPSQEVQIYPNPCKDIAIVNFDLYTNTLVVLSIENLLGDVIRTLDNSYRSGGTYDVTVDVRDLKQGIFQIHLVTSEYEARTLFKKEE